MIVLEIDMKYFQQLLRATYQIPLAHIHGGEVTSGALDDGFRHSITIF